MGREANWRSILGTGPHALVLAAMALLAGLTVGCPAVAAATPIRCDALDLRTTATVDELLCTSTISSSVSISMDGGRSFTSTRTTGTGLVDRLIDGAFSPNYDADHTIYLRYASQGLMASTDGGHTLVPVDPVGGSSFAGVRMGSVDSFQSLPAGLATVPALTVPGGGSAAVVAGAPVPIAGSGKTSDLRFVQLGAGGVARVVAIGTGLNSRGTSNIVANPCAAALACPSGHDFPDGQFLGDAATQPGSAVGLLVVALNHQTGGNATSAVWISRDAGASYTPCAGLHT